MSNENKRASRLSTVRKFLPLAILIIAAIGFICHLGIGTLSDFGWQDISILCPLGALTTMIASKTVIPHAVISLVVAVLLILLFGRAFCGWICPVPHVSKLRGLFSSKSATGSKKPQGLQEGAKADHAKAAKDGGCGASNSRYLVAGGAVLSAAVFGFPVFCLICPIGLTFATIFLVIRAFGFGDVGIALVIVPLVLLCEVVFFRKWCHKFCPLGALMSLVGKANRTLQPAVDCSLCLESDSGRACGACAKVCPEGIDPRHRLEGTSDMSECTRCRKCADGCPGHAITFPFLAPKAQDAEPATAHDVNE